MSWDACTMERSDVLRWIECHPSTMAMAQSAVTLLAILAAILIPILIRNREESYPARAYRKRLLSLMKALEGTARKTSYFLTRIAPREALKKSELSAVLFYGNRLEALLSAFRETKRDSLLPTLTEALMPSIRSRLNSSAEMTIFAVQCLANKDPRTTREEVASATLTFASELRSGIDAFIGPTIRSRCRLAATRVKMWWNKWARRKLIAKHGAGALHKAIVVGKVWRRRALKTANRLVRARKPRPLGDSGEQRCE